MWVFGIFLISLLSASCLICWFVIYFLKRGGGGGGGGWEATKQPKDQKCKMVVLNYYHLLLILYTPCFVLSLAHCLLQQLTTRRSAPLFSFSAYFVVVLFLTRLGA
jgi:hypothetical protein